MATHVSDKPASKHEAFIEAQLARTQRRIRFIDLSAALLGFVAGSLLFLAVAMLLDRAFALSNASRQITLLLYLVAAGAYLAYAFRPMWWKVNPHYAARQLESTLESDRNHVINWLDLRGQKLPAVIRSSLGQRAAKDLSTTDPDQAIAPTRLYAGGVAAGLGVVLLVILFFAFGATIFRTLLGRAFAPFGQGKGIPTRTQVSVVRPQGGDAVVTIGNPVTLVASVSGRVPSARAKDAPALLYRHDPSEPYRQRYLQIDESGTEWAATVAAVDVGGGFFYKVTAGDAETPEYRITARAAPLIGEVLVKYRHRPYTDKPDRTSTDRRIEGLQGTDVTLTVRTNRTVGSGQMLFDRGLPAVVSQPVEGEPAAMRFRFTLRTSDAYRIEFATNEGEKYIDSASTDLVVIPDNPPTVRITEPAKDVELASNGHLELKGEVNDDIGIAKVTLLLSLNGKSIASRPYLADKLARPGYGTPRFLEYHHLLELPALMDEAGKPVSLKPGDVVEYQLLAADACDVREPPVSSVSEPRYKITIVEQKKDDAKQKQERDEAKKREQEQKKQQDEKLKEQEQKRQEQNQKEQQQEKADAEKRDAEKNQSGKGDDKKNEGGEGAKEQERRDEKTREEADRIQKETEKDQKGEGKGDDQKNQDKAKGEGKDGGDKNEKDKQGEGKGAGEKKDDKDGKDGKPGESGMGKGQDSKGSEGKPGQGNQQGNDKVQGSEGKDPPKDNKDGKAGESKDDGKGAPGKEKGERKPTDGPRPGDDVREGKGKPSDTEGKPIEDGKPGQSPPKTDGKPGESKDGKAGEKGSDVKKGENGGQSGESKPPPPKNETPGKGKGSPEPKDATPQDVKQTADALEKGTPKQRQQAAKDLEEMKQKGNDQTSAAAKKAIEDAKQKGDLDKDGKAPPKPKDDKADQGEDGEGSGKPGENSKKSDEQGPGQPGKAKGKEDSPQGSNPGEGGDKGRTNPGSGSGGENELPVKNQKPGKHRASQLQLEKFQKLDQATLDKMKMSREQYQKFLRDYADLAKRQDRSTPETLPGPSKSGALPSIGGKTIAPTGQGKDGLKGEGRPKPPPGYRDQYNELLRRMNEPQR